MSEHEPRADRRGFESVENDNRISGPAFRRFVNHFTQNLISRHLSKFNLGKALLQVRIENLWDKWPRSDRDTVGYSDWQEFCDRVLDYSGRSADELIRNYERLDALHLDETGDTFMRALRLGWTKLAEVLRVARTEDHMVQWLNYIDQRNLSVQQLRAHINQAREDAEEEGDDEEEAAEGTDADTDPTEEEEDDPSISFLCRFPDARAQTTVTNAVETVRRHLGENISVGRALAMISTHYLGHAPRIDEGGPVIELEDVIRSIEENYRVSLQVVPNRSRRRGSPRRRSRSTNRG